VGLFTVREITLLAALGDGLGVGEVHPLIKVQGVGVADMRDEGHEPSREENEDEK